MLRVTAAVGGGVLIGVIGVRLVQADGGAGAVSSLGGCQVRPSKGHSWAERRPRAAVPAPYVAADALDHCEVKAAEPVVPTREMAPKSSVESLEVARAKLESLEAQLVLDVPYEVERRFIHIAAMMGEERSDDDLRPILQEMVTGFDAVKALQERATIIDYDDAGEERRVYAPYRAGVLPEHFAGAWQAVYERIEPYLRQSERAAARLHLVGR